MSYETQGLTVTFVGGEEKKTERYSVRILRGTVMKKYGETMKEQVMEFAFSNKNMDKLDGLKKGDVVSVKWDIDSREYNGRVYTNLNGWAVDKNGSSKNTEEEQDLPF